ncbi:MAG: 16S rRNA methyltransferase, partial [Candidatus Thorarchaeota archaeon]
MPLVLILVECGLELIPQEIKNHPSVLNNLRKDDYSSKLLDNALHHSAMGKLSNFEKRGRPDITHNCLLNALGSPLNKNGNLKLYIHTYHKKIFEINPEIKLTRNYNRFKGLMAKLLYENELKFENLNLITAVNKTLEELVNNFKKKKVLIFSFKGQLLRYQDQLFEKDLSKNYLVIIGGFQKGFFSSEVVNLSNKLISISNYPLDAWIVVNKVISLYEITNDIL